MDAFLDFHGLSVMDRQKAQWLMADYARELAEKIRTAQHGPEGETWNWWDAAEIPEACAALIDPEVDQ